MKIYIKKDGKYIEIIHEKNIAKDNKERERIRKRRNERLSRGIETEIYTLIGGVYYPINNLPDLTIYKK